MPFALIAVIAPPRAPYLDSLGLQHFGSGVENWCAYVAGQRSGMMTRPPPVAMDIVLIQDMQLDEEQEEVLRDVFRGERPVGVVLHEGSRHRPNHEVRLGNALADRFPTPKIEHSTTGRVVDFLTRISRARTPQEYGNTLDELVKHVCGDPVLEARLDLLHRCLTPEGAGDLPQGVEMTALLGHRIEVHVGGFSQELSDNGAGAFASRADVGDGSRRTLRRVRDVTEYLAEQQDCFAEHYIRTLECLRDQLLTG